MLTDDRQLLLHANKGASVAKQNYEAQGFRSLQVAMRTELEKITDAALTLDQKSARRVAEAGLTRTADASKKLATARLRTAIAELTDRNMEQFQFWLDYVALDDPKGALDIVVRMLEFSVPKLSRVEAQISSAGTVALEDLTIGELKALLVKAQTDERTFDGEAEEIPE